MSKLLSNIDFVSQIFQRFFLSSEKKVKLLLGKAEEAEISGEFKEDCYKRAIYIQPKSARLHLLYGNFLTSQGRLQEAIAAYDEAIVCEPHDADTHFYLGNIYRSLGYFQSAFSSYCEAIYIRPDFIDAIIARGKVFEDLDHAAEAIASYRSALMIDPSHILAHRALASILVEYFCFHEAIEHLRFILDSDPNQPEIELELAKALHESGCLEEALQVLEKLRTTEGLMSNKSVWIQVYSAFLFVLSRCPLVNPNKFFEEHCYFGKILETPLLTSCPEHKNERDEERTLRVGFVSGDFFSDHPVLFFFEPIIQSLNQSKEITLHAYYFHVIEDHTTQRMKTCFHFWNSVSGLSDDALFKKIMDDKIDILIDLAGHTRRNRLACFAKKPAPIQISWIGYPGTSGLKAMDYYHCDPFFLPIEIMEGQFTEKLAYLPAAAPFLPPESLPEVSDLPAIKNGYFSFGEFNRLNKLNEQIVLIWCDLLRSVPQSRLILADIPEEKSVTSRIEAWFHKGGVSSDRLQFVHRLSLEDYMALHHQVDLCLDTLPYSGGTTVLYAICMGVPTLTMPGSIPPGRQGGCAMSHVNLAKEFVCENPDDFVAKGKYWSEHLDELALIRKNLRQELAKSPVGRPEVITEAAQKSWRFMWRRWCQGLPPEHIPLETIQ